MALQLSPMSSWMLGLPQSMADSHELKTRGQALRQQILREKLRREAPADINSFIEYVLKDEKGQPIHQAEVHKWWHKHIAFCEEIGKRPLIMAPWGHGKTVQLVIGRTLFELGQNRNQRIGIVCNADANARKRVTAIKSYIERDADFHRIFPGVKPDRKTGWGKAEFYVERDEGARSVDPSVFSAGIFSTGIGGRMDGLVIDDPVDLRNAISMPKLREAVVEAIKNVWMSRLEPWGWLIYVATAWHPLDATHQFLRDPEVRGQYLGLIQRISDDYERIECYLVGSSEGGVYPIVKEGDRGGSHQGTALQGGL